MDSSKSEYFEKLSNVDGLVLYKCFVENWDKVMAFQARPDDILIATYPKSGTTWISEIIDMIYKDGNAERCKEDAIFNRIPFLECKKEDALDGIKQLKAMASPRIIKTHLPADYLPVSFWENNCKMIYLCRNAKDVAVSYYYFHLMVPAHPNPGTFAEFVEKYMNGEVPYGTWYKHVKSWEKRKHSNMLFMFYEDMQKDIRKEVIKLYHFLGKKPSEELVDKIVNHTSFQEMKENPTTNYTTLPEEDMNQKICPFMRKGCVGDWKNHFTVALNERFEMHYEKEMKGSTLTLHTEI
ncbi:PREDICTED: estrogen sulfotransferase [Chrysochloris asiatica]|uniref:Sulfotransferase n=1 Tax=Chrysochloris asiatica TaxID=185453 RepID=A0A9B0TYR2_CHRAS|nr:PREDICTED: estrogen sulfotransferase [Chrysochloris asiatica]